MSVAKKVEALLKLPGNNFCADCGCPKPNWASASLGVFVCFNCSGLHRGLGTHLSFVRSVNMDNWTEKQYKKMKEWGNNNANAYFEAKLPASLKKPTQDSSVNEMNRFIRDKYEMNSYVPDNGKGDPRRGAKPGNRARAPEPTPEPVKKSSKPRLKTGRKAAVAKPAKAAPDLLSFDAPEPAAPAQAFAAFGAPSPPQAAAQAPFAAFGAPQQPQAAPFDAFGTGAPAAAGFDAFGASAPAPPAPQPAPASADAILSMFNAPPAMQRGGPMPMQRGEPMPGGFPAQRAAQGRPRGPPMGNGSRPMTIQPTAPQQQMGFPPQQQMGYARPPQQQMPRGYPPQQQMGFPPQQQMGYAPQQQMGYAPQQQGGYAQRPPMPPQQGYGMAGGRGMPSPMMSPRGMAAPPRQQAHMPPKQDSMPGGFGPGGFSF